MIIIGIPTYNEADSIVQAVQKIEKAILYYSKKQRVPSNEFILVNADNNSPDMTGQKFLNLKTKMKKKLIITNGRGKGRNLIAIFRFAKRIKALAVATIDADITTIQDDWIARLIDPIIQNKTDMTVPIYKRNRFEGSTTNHFAFPLIYSYFGQNIRQPIGGEFGFSDKMINYLLKQKVISSTYLYGIDIFCTIHAVGGGFKVKSVFLGKKWHKPSFPKIAPMFTEVATSAFDTIKHYQLQKTNNPYYKKTNNRV